MKILFVHNVYQHRGGEDAVVATETRLLRAHGHEVVEFFEDNNRIEGVNRLQLAATTIWSRKARRDLESIVRHEKPSIVHYHNTFPLISPAAYYACQKTDIPVVQTLHNYRLLCPGGGFYRANAVCEECLTKAIPWPGVLHGCYRESRIATSVVAGMLTVHRTIGTWSRQVDTYIALTEFSRRKFIEGGMPGERIFVKPNFAAVDTAPTVRLGDYALYLGRLSREKGPRILLDAWRQISRDIPLRIAGDGPLRPELEVRRKNGNFCCISFLGRVDPCAVQTLLRGARFLIVPSECYENFPLAVVEAFACGVPVIASRLGALEEIVEDRRTGLHFTPGDPKDLAAKVEWAWTHPQEMEAMGRNARAEYEAKYTPERNYEMLMEIYDRVIHTRPWPVKESQGYAF